MKLVTTIIFCLVFGLAGCTHTIRHVPPNFVSKASTGEISLLVSPTITQKIVEQRIGINVDKWRFEIGNAFMSIVPSALETHFAKVNVVQSASDKLLKSNSIYIESLDIELDSGTTVLSKHEVILKTQVSYFRKDGSRAFDRTFINRGSQSGSSQLLTWLPFMQMAGMNDSIELAVTDSLLALSEDLIKSIS